MPPQSPILNATDISVIVHRKDSADQIAWTGWRTDIVVSGGTAAEAGSIAMLGPDGQLHPSFIPASIRSAISVNGATVNNPDFNDTTPAPPPGYSNVYWQHDPSGNVSAYYSTSGTTVPFGEVLSGTSTGQTLIVGDGTSLTATGTGTIGATELATTSAPVDVSISAPTHAGQLLISQPGNASAAWADPMVQGLYPPGTDASAAGSPPEPIYPVLIGGEGADGLLHSISTDNSGNLNVSIVGPSLYFSAMATASGNTAVWTPSSGKKFRLMRFMLQTTEDVTQGVSGNIIFALYDGSTPTPFAFDVYVPAQGQGLVDRFCSPWIDLGAGFLSAAADNVLNLNLSGTLGTGTARIIVCGVEE